MNRKTNPEYVNRSVTITGIGMISPVGSSTSECWEACCAGTSGIREITKFDACECRTRIGGQLPESYYQLESGLFSKRMFKQTTSLSRLTRVCAEEAIQNSRLDVSRTNPEKVGVIIGASGASVISMEGSVHKAVDRFTIIREMINAIPARISLDHGLKGPSYAVSASSESGLCAIVKAYDLIRTGVAEVVIAGGADTLLCKSYIDYFNSLGLLSTENDIPDRAVKPFDRLRNGFVLSDGAGMVVLESLGHAVGRNAKIYGYLRGYSASWASSKSSDSMSETMSRSLRNSQISLSDIGYVAANGTATIEDDRMESFAIQKLFGGQTLNLPITSVKSMIGHAMGASGVIQFGLAAMALYSKKIPPTINHLDTDPECARILVPNQVIHSPGMRAVLVNSFGFKGHHYALTLGTHPEGHPEHESKFLP